MGDGAGVTVEGAAGAKPGIRVPGGEAPAELVIHDVIEGSGDPVQPGAMVVAHYVGVGWDSGAQFDASWDRGAPLRLPLGQVIAGWQQGIPGMRPGGRRLLVIPAPLAYGDRPPLGSGIGRGEALVFVIDLVR